MVFFRRRFREAGAVLVLVGIVVIPFVSRRAQRILRARIECQWPPQWSVFQRVTHLGALNQPLNASQSVWILCAGSF